RRSCAATAASSPWPLPAEPAPLREPVAGRAPTPRAERQAAGTPSASPTRCGTPAGMHGSAWPGRDTAWTFLAPMEGVTDPAFRELIARRPGVGVVCTEFVRIAATGLGAKYLR